METSARPSGIRSSNASRLESHLGYWLRRVSNHVSGGFARALQARQTSVAEWVVLCHLHEHPGITSGETADALHLTRGAVSKIIDKLEAKKWMLRSVHPEDGRVQLLTLTREGRRILPKLAEIADQNDRDCFQGLNEAERATLRRLLGKLVDFHQIRDVPIE